ncbi:type II toxin-antitoxin system RelE/ParE family toxin [Moraxella canis]|uniref:Type II toxin-antitoxin system RelE/ParE family toxin n=1 Tax=Moraxella canis TaxID=90239 RepID=A0ABZ0WX69_9GAMM|nr:type II toxin-antitoxin system RelE/ParE family toxin [Moraxella canis]WQE03857.1 type II toxin-antitoxin system RelE/ParE family toxin [Moraxella canis]
MRQAYTIAISDDAKQALMSLYEYYVDVASYIMAEANITAIQEAISSLEYFPERCPMADFSPNIRKMVVPKLPFLVYYTIIEDTVHILEVLDGRRAAATPPVVTAPSKVPVARAAAAVCKATR